jgi:DNA-directed RNA polymerase beta subunit
MNLNSLSLIKNQHEVLNTFRETELFDKTSLSLTKNSKKSRHSSKFHFSAEIPNLIDVQRQSFYSFVETGIKKPFSSPLSFSTKTHSLEITFFPECIQFQKPTWSEKQAFVLGKTYGSSVYIPVAIKTNTSRTLRVEWLLVGFLPLMTKHGHFIINGITRVVLHQILRNPGVYVIPRDSRTQTATVRIVPEKGGWINLTVDKKNRFWFSTRTLRRKVSLLVILQALGYSIYDLRKLLRHPEILENSYVKKISSEKWDYELQRMFGKTRHDQILIRAGLRGHPGTQEGAWSYLYSHYLEYQPYSKNDSGNTLSNRDFFTSRLWNQENLFLGKLGRQQFFEKLGSPELLDSYFLTGEDLLCATQALIDLIHKKRLGDEIDSLTQKRIHGCDQFLLEQLLQGVKEFEIFFTRKINSLPSSRSSLSVENVLETLWRQNKIVFSKTITKSWKSFFTSGTLAQFMDQTNPLAETTHKRRLTVLGPGGVSSKQTTIQIRSIHPTYYGRLCPIETPEGKNAGLVNSFTVFASYSKDFFGTIKTPFYQVYKGQVQKKLPPFFVTPHQESHQIIAPPDLRPTAWNMLPKRSLPVRKELKFESEISTRITAQSVGILQTISVATSLIPFLEHDDANRALMGSNMQRQAVPLLQPEGPVVGTGLETRVVSDVNHVLQASNSGYITSLKASSLKILEPGAASQKLKFFSSFPFPFPKFGLKTFPKFGLKTKFWEKEKEKERERQGKGKGRKTEFWKKSRLSQKFSPSAALSKLQLLEQPKNFTDSFSSSKTETKSFENFEKKISEKSGVTRKNSSLKTHLFWKGNTFFFEDRKFFKFPVDKKPKKQAENNDEKITSTYSLTRFQRTNQSTCLSERPILSETCWVEKGDILADGAASSRGKLAIGKNIVVAYLPWEGYNFEDAILISQRLVDQDIFTSLHIDHYDIEVKNTQYGLEMITHQIPLKIHESTREILKIEKLNSKGLVEIGSWVEEGDYLVGKISPLNPKGPSVEQQYEKLYNVIMQREKTNFRNTSLRVPKGVEGFVLDVQILPSLEPDVAALAEKNALVRVRVVLLQRRKIQVGDKMAGRHGNKGIVSNLLPRQDMPYLPDGTPVDIVLNPLGVPSRMNVGQILECLLGLAGRYLNESYTTHLFDEQFGAEASRSLVYSKLYQASIKTGNPWLFEPHHPGKIKLFDGRTGFPFDQPVTVGCAYILKLVHLVDDKIHARATGPYSAVTQQPVRGRSRNGGQRLGEMEVWALQAYGAAQTLHELLTLKSDDIEGRKQTVLRIYANKPLPAGRSESFKVVLRELQALCFNLELSGTLYRTETKSMVMPDFFLEKQFFLK